MDGSISILVSYNQYQAVIPAITEEGVAYGNVSLQYIYSILNSFFNKTDISNINHLKIHRNSSQDCTNDWKLMFAFKSFECCWTIWSHMTHMTPCVFDLSHTIALIYRTSALIAWKHGWILNFPHINDVNSKVIGLHLLIISLHYLKGKKRYGKRIWPDSTDKSYALTPKGGSTSR